MNEEKRREICVSEQLRNVRQWDEEKRERERENERIVLSIKKRERERERKMREFNNSLDLAREEGRSVQR